MTVTIGYAAALERIVETGLAEDVGTGDVTSEAVVPADRRAVGVVLLKAPGVVAGLDAMEAVFRRLDSDASWEVLVADGAHVTEVPCALARVEGAARALVGTAVEIIMPLGGLIDPAVESKRLEKDITKVDKEIQQLEGKLANQAFLSRAPEDVVTEIRERLAEEQTRRGRLVAARETLTGAPS